MTGSLRSERTFSDVVKHVARELVTVEELTDGALISTPLLYPSGATVVIRIDQNGSNYFLTDMGLGYQEADLPGASLLYTRQAKSVAEEFGVGFDDHALFLNDISRERLPGAVGALANASLQAITLAAYRLSERKNHDAAEFLYQRLIKVFTPSIVARDTQLLGASNTEWHVANLVRFQEKVTVFEAVTSHRNSITSATAKFHDLARLPEPPNRVAVVGRKEDLGTLLGVLSQAASVVTRSVPDQTIKRLAA